MNEINSPSLFTPEQDRRIRKIIEEELRYYVIRAQSGFENGVALDDLEPTQLHQEQPESPQQLPDAEHH